VPGYISECDRVSIDVKCPNSARLLVLPNLFLEELSEVGRGYGKSKLEKVPITAEA